MNWNIAGWKLHYRIYQQHLLMLPLSSAIFAVLLFTGRESAENLQFMLLVYGEVFLPPFAGWIASGLLLGDPCRELLFCSPVSAWHTIVKRLSILLAMILFSWGSLLLVYFPGSSLNISILQLFFGGLSTSLAFVGVGTWGAIRFCSRISGGLVVVAIWASGLLFRLTLLSNPLGHIIHPFLTFEAPDSALWLTNTVTLCFFAILLFVLAYQLIDNEERLLPIGGEEENV